MKMIDVSKVRVFRESLCIAYALYADRLGLK